MRSLLMIALVCLVAATSYAAAPAASSSAGGGGHAQGANVGGGDHGVPAALHGLHGTATPGAASVGTGSPRYAVDSTVTHETIAGKAAVITTVKGPRLSANDKRVLRQRNWIEQPAYGPEYFCEDTVTSPSQTTERNCFRVERPKGD